MRSRLVSNVLVAAVVAAALACWTAAPANAAAHRHFHPRLAVKSANGFHVEVTTTGAAVAVVVNGKDVATEYLTRGLTSSRRVKATFGHLGDVDMRFRPARRQPPAQKGRSCHGKHRLAKWRGVFVGSLRFRGENGYVSVRVHRAAGEMVSVAARCTHQPTRTVKRDSSLIPPGLLQLFPDTAYLSASWRDGPSRSASVLGFRLKQRVSFIASSEETHGRLVIIRAAFVDAERSDLSINEALDHGRASPPAPFHGSATYRAAPDGSTSWQGDLTVNFPGYPRFPLTGGAFKAEAWRSF